MTPVEKEFPVSLWFRGPGRQFAPLPRLDLLAHRLEISLRAVDPTETQSISETDFECLTSTGVNAPGTMFPGCGPEHYFEKSPSTVALHVSTSGLPFLPADSSTSHYESVARIVRLAPLRT